MIRRKTEGHIGIVIESDDEGPISWCTKCLSRNTKTKMGEKIVMDPNLPPNPADEQFRQCPKCYHIEPIYNVKYEGETYSDLEIIENPFDYSKAKIIGMDDTLKGRMKRNARRKNVNSINDKEIQAYLDNGWEVTAFSEDTPQESNSQGFY